MHCREIKRQITALASVAQWIEHWPENQRVASLIPHQGTAWVAGQIPGGGGRMTSNHTLMFLSLSFSFLSLLTKIK